jgi:hypothetical protein
LLPILLIQENKLTPITAAHQVIASSCILNAQWVEPLTTRLSNQSDSVDSKL